MNFFLLLRTRERQWMTSRLPYTKINDDNRKNQSIYPLDEKGICWLFKYKYHQFIRMKIIRGIRDIFMLYHWNSHSMASWRHLGKNWNILAARWRLTITMMMMTIVPFDKYSSNFISKYLCKMSWVNLWVILLDFPFSFFSLSIFD